MSDSFSADEDFARQQDREDSLRLFRDRFHIPADADGQPRLIYFVGNSLGLMPKATRKIVEQELSDWAQLGVDGHFDAATPWYSYHGTLREPVARLVGAQPNEVVCMNSLTVNLHLLMATFYRPTKARHKILMEDPSPSTPTRSSHRLLIMASTRPRRSCSLGRGKGEYAIRQEDIESLIEKHGDEIALVLFADKSFHRSALRYRENHGSGPETRLHRRDRSRTCGRQCPARAARLERRLRRLVLQQISQLRPLVRSPARSSTNGTRPTAAFRVSLDGGATTRQRASACSFEPEFLPVASAGAPGDRNPPIFAMAPLRTSFAIFDEAGR